MRYGTYLQVFNVDPSDERDNWSDDNQPETRHNNTIVQPLG